MLHSPLILKIKYKFDKWMWKEKRKYKTLWKKFWKNRLAAKLYFEIYVLCQSRIPSIINRVDKWCTRELKTSTLLNTRHKIEIDLNLHCFEENLCAPNKHESDLEYTRDWKQLFKLSNFAHEVGLRDNILEGDTITFMIIPLWIQTQLT